MVSRRQLKMAIEIIGQAFKEDFSEIKSEIVQTLDVLKKELDNSEEAYKLLSIDQGKSTLVHGFDNHFFLNLKIVHSLPVQKFIENWLTKQSDWRFSWCWICRSHIFYTPLSVKSHLVYLCTKFHQPHHVVNLAEKHYKEHKDLIANKIRFKPLNDHGLIHDIDVPYNQIGTLVCLDYFPYLSLDQINKFLQSFKKVLRPGGQALIHYADGDNEEEWKSVVKKKITYCSEEIIKKYCKDLSLKCEFYHVDSMYSFVVITKMGEKDSIKAHMTKIVPVKSQV